jgi:subtilisin family serine protease
VIAAVAAVPGVAEVRSLAPGLLAVATDGPTEPLSAVPGVAGVDEDVLLRFGDLDPQFGRQWALRNVGDPAQTGGTPSVAGVDIGAPEAWAVATGAGQTIAVIDSGVALDHPDLAGRSWRNDAEFCGNGLDDDANGLADDCVGWDFGGDDPDPRPDPAASVRNHGTHVAGIAAATLGNGIGIAGVAPDARIMALKVSRGEMLPSSTVVAAMRYAVDHGATVINLSLGVAGVTRQRMGALEHAIAYAQAAGVTVIAAAGNAGSSLDVTDTWPAGYARWYDNVVTVGATTATDARASFSNYGTPVVVWAPGSYVYSTLADGLGYGFMSGTSMATPIVSGAVAVLRSAGTTDAGAIRTAITAAAVRAGPGPRLHLGATLTGNGSGPPSSTMTAFGLDAVRAGSPSTIDLAVEARNLGAATARIRLAMATREGGSVYGVGALSLSLTDAGAAPVAVVSDDGGTLGWSAAVPAAELASTGRRLRLFGALPEGRYAIVAELIGPDGTSLDRPLALTFDVAAAPGATTGPVRVSTAPVPSSSASPVTAPATTPPTTRPGSSVAPTTRPASPSAPTTTPTAVTPAPPSAPTTTPTAVTPTPALGSTAPGLPPIGGSSGGGRAGPEPAVSGGGSAGAPGSGTAPIATAPASGTGPRSGDPIEDTRPPVEAGAWSFQSAVPAAGPTSGGTALTLNGRFPVGRTVYVWFGASVAQAVAPTAGSLVVHTPPAASPGAVDVSVRFNDGGRLVALTRPSSFTYLAPADRASVDALRPQPTRPSVPSTSPATTSPATAGPPATSPATTAARPGAPPPAPPPTARTVPTTPTTRPATAPAPPPTTGPAPVPTAMAGRPPAPRLQRGPLTLVVPATSSLLARLEPAHLATPCSASTCRAVRLG